MTSNLARANTAAEEGPHGGPYDSIRPEEQLRLRLTKLLEDIRRDASTEPARYLRETVVPEGGE
ncbi:MAG: hypothetical protein IPK13_07680 [Deltaproteobacteria bacterium]|nr:hypothetical protein [Deltaproteobacteria bacterium]